MLLQTKLSIPPTRESLISRPRLIEKLDTGLVGKLTLISAPAGFGKTSLIAAYDTKAATTGETTVAWLSLGEDENDPARFMAYFLAALAGAGIDVAQEETAVSATSPDLIMAGVVNDITETFASKPNAHLIFVLDDYHLINNQVIHEAISFLLEHMPPHMHLVLVSRADPPLPLARWRAQGQLVELRQDDLRFKPEEAADFLNQVMALSLSGSDIHTLNRRTEGWIAGLKMAAVSLQGRSDAADFVQSFGGSHRFILDYLMEEVLSRQPEEITRFLLQTAVLERLCAPLCDDILEISDWKLENTESSISSLQSQQILEYLDNANLFIIPLDQERRWYRYHRLFADLLRQRLAQTNPMQIPILHERAAAWFKANGFPEEAINHALQGGAADHAADLIEQIAEAKLMRSELVIFMRWLAALPKSELAKRPSLSLYYAWALIMEGRAQTEVELALRPISVEGAPGELALVHSLLALLRGDGTTAVELARQSLTQLAPEHTFLRGVTTWVLGMSLLFCGELDHGVETLEEAVQISQQVGNMTIAATSLGRLANQAWRGGDLHRAKRIYDQALVLATDEAERPLPIAGESHVGLARIYFEWNDLETAVAHVETGLALMERWRELSAMAAYLWSMRIREALGNPEAADNALERARQIAIQSKGTQFDDLAVSMSEASLHLLRGNLETVAAWCTERKIPQEVDVTALRQHDDLIEGHMRKYEYLVLARLRLAQNRPDEALTLLPPLLAEAQRLQRCDLQIEIRILTALAHQQKREFTQADQQMQDALKLSQPGGFTRLFVEAGPDIVEILKRQKTEIKRMRDEGGRMNVYLQTLLAACDQLADQSPISSLQSSASSELIEPLSGRELEVLTLIADGLSNREIAQELVLSLPTIKWHTSNIYGKLGVGNRTTAVARARELQLLY